MHWKVIVDLAVRYGVPFAQELFARNWDVVVGDDGKNVSWATVQVHIAEGRALAQQGKSIADEQIAYHQAREIAELVPVPAEPLGEANTLAASAPADAAPAPKPATKRATTTTRKK